jgi:hypothetical protein
MASFGAQLRPRNFFDVFRGEEFAVVEYKRCGKFSVTGNRGNETYTTVLVVRAFGEPEALCVFVFPSGSEASIYSFMPYERIVMPASFASI